MGPRKKFNAIERGHGSQPEERHNKGDNKEPLRRWTCGGEHHMRDCSSHHGGRPWIYSARHRKLGMLVGLFPKFMQWWITGNLIIKHLLSRWNVSFVIKLFLFSLILDLIISILALT